MIGEKLQAFSDLQRRMHNCRLCLDSGYDIYPRAIFSGALGARIMTIGQAPGITEKEAGRPFNAGSGKRLFQWLAQAGIEETWFRKSQYMTSVTKCYPGRSRSGNGDRLPSRGEQEFCRPFLDTEINLVDPDLIIPIGRLAIGLFYPAALGLDQIIGTEKKLEKCWIIPLPHSSGASRWHQIPENRQRLQVAIQLIALRVDSLNIKNDRTK